MGSLENVTTIDNPVYDPDGDELTFTSVAVDNNRDHVPPVHSVQSEQMLILKEKPYDKKSLPHQVKFVRRKKITRQCVLIILLLTVILIGLAIGIFFVATKGSSHLSKDYDTQEVEGQFRIVNRDYTDALSIPSKPEFRNLSSNLKQLIRDVFQSEDDDVTILVSDVIVIGFRPGSIVVLYQIMLGQVYNATFAEKQLHELFVRHTKATKDFSLELSDYVIDRITVHFNALPLTYTNGKTDKKTMEGPTTSSSAVTEHVSANVPRTSSMTSSTTSTLLASTRSEHQSAYDVQPSTAALVHDCQPITIDFCMNTSQVPYTESVFPNWLGDTTLAAVDRALWQFRRFVQNKCHPYIRRFICAVLVPRCVESRLEVVKLPPCRRLCYEISSRCISPLFSQVKFINCEDLPDSDDPNVCVGAPALPKYPLRLSGGLGPKEGHVEVYYEGSWGKICDTHWDDKAAEVICRQLKLSGKSKAFRNSYFGVNGLSTHFRDVRCSGFEEHLALCNMVIGSDSWCNEEHAAGVICDYDNRNVSLSVRLLGGDGHSTGRLEVFYNNTWGTVCDDEFGDAEAIVVCHMLGYRYSGQVKSQAEMSGLIPSTGPIWLSSLKCTGDETSLVQCTHNGWGSDMCEHDEDVYIECEQQPSSSRNSSQNKEEFRLVDGDQFSGRIEVKHNNVWGTVCRHLFNNKTAAVFCRTLKLSDKYATYEMSRYGRGTGPVWLDGLYCTGSEQTILDCKHQGWGNTEGCDHLNDVSISCQPVIDSESSSKSLLRLVGGELPSVGRVEVYYSGRWGSVCNHGFDNRTASVLCRMMGYNGTGQYLVNAHIDDGTSQPVVMDHLNCIGDEKTIFDCMYWPEEEITCDHRQDVVISCHNDVIVYNVHLFGGEHPSEGFVELMYDGVWGTVCNKGFGKPEAAVTCSMMGYHGDVQVLHQKQLDEHRHMLWSGVSCNGNERSLYECTHTDDIGDCDDWVDHVYIVCDAAAQTPLRIVPLNQSLPNKGRVEVKIGGTWGTICHFNTNKQTVLVLCRGLGYKTLTTEDVSVVETELPGEGPIWLSELECEGAESDVRHCQHEGHHYSEMSCDHDEDLVIQCGKGK